MFLLLEVIMKAKKQLYIDLHSHTNYSDGLYTTPRQNVMLAALNGLDVFAVTDHDTTKGYYESKSEAMNVGITLLPGVEITTPRYHLLSLNFDPENKPLLDFLQSSKDIQRDRCKSRVNALRAYGYDLTFKEITDAFPDSRLAKYNIFAAMFMNSKCRDRMENDYPGLLPLQRFRKLFSKEGPIGYLPDDGVSESEAINYVHNAGGIIGIAHPPRDIEYMDEMNALLELGIDFVEVQPHFRGRENKKYKTEDFEKFARENNLPLSYGSDYHGSTFDRVILGREENILHPDLEELLNQGYARIPDFRLEEVCS